MGIDADCFLPYERFGISQQISDSGVGAAISNHLQDESLPFTQLFVSMIHIVTKMSRNGHPLAIVLINTFSLAASLFLVTCKK